MAHKKNFRFKKSEIGVFNSSAEQVADTLKKESRIMGLTRGKFSLIDMIYYILKKTGPADVICCTWSAGVKDAHQVEWMLNSELIKSFTLVTDHSYATRQRKYAVTLEALFGIENIRTSEVHAKFTLIKTPEWNITIRTSMNLNANKTCENFEIDDDSDIYDFYFDFIKHHVVNNPEGFEPRSWVVDRSLDEFFGSRETEPEFTFWSSE